MMVTQGGTKYFILPLWGYQSILNVFMLSCENHTAVTCLGLLVVCCCIQTEVSGGKCR